LRRGVRRLRGWVAAVRCYPDLKPASFKDGRPELIRGRDCYDRKHVAPKVTFGAELEAGGKRQLLPIGFGSIQHATGVTLSGAVTSVVRSPARSCDVPLQSNRSRRDTAKPQLPASGTGRGELCRRRLLRPTGGQATACPCPARTSFAGTVARPRPRPTKCSRRARTGAC